MDIKKIQKSATRYTIPNKKFSKVFCIGYNKTGTTSIETVFKALGLRIPNQHKQELRIVKQFHEGNFDPLKEFVAQYEAFQDQPFSDDLCFAQVDVLFPKSKFILTVRDPEEWYDSLVRFHVKTFNVESVKDFTEDFFKDKMIYLYENYAYENKRRWVTTIENYKAVARWDLLYDKDLYIKRYSDRNNQIINYFQYRPDDLLVIDIAKEKDISKILDFLGFPQNLNCEMPHQNSSK